MTSRSLQAALVSFINSIRAQKPGYVELRHGTFLAKVRTVLAYSHQKFLSAYGSATGEQQPMYRFPKREATLMAMSYSHKSINIVDQFDSEIAEK